MSSCFAIVTGTTSGVGEAVATTLLERGWRVLGIARRAASIHHANYEHMRLNLAETSTLPRALEPRLASLVTDASCERIGLVNNAAVPGLLGPFHALDVERLPSVFATNTIAPMWLMGAVVRLGHAGARVRIVNVSSGAAVHAFAGLGAYGSSKAALRMAGMVLATELDGASYRGPRDVSILSFEPGTVDTPMQENARRSSPEVLPSIDLFHRFSNEGMLLPPSAPATAIADYLDADGHAPFEERRYGR